MAKLLQMGADANQTDEFGRTCLHLACNWVHRRDMKEPIKLLLDHEADAMAVDLKKRTPAYYLFVRKNMRAEVSQFEPMDHGLDILINEKTRGRVNVNHQDCNGKTLLHYAAQRGSIKSLEYLIMMFGKEGLNMALEDKWLNTPLSVAINNKHFAFIEKLFEYELVSPKGFIYEEPRPRMAMQQDDE